MRRRWLACRAPTLFGSDPRFGMRLCHRVRNSLLKEVSDGLLPIQGHRHQFCNSFLQQLPSSTINLAADSL
jgi:hypothetical protein